MYLDLQNKRLAPEQEKGELEWELTLYSQSEIENMGAQPHGENEESGKPSFDFWDQIFS